MRASTTVSALGVFILLATLVAAGCSHCPVHRLLFPSHDEAAAEQVPDVSAAEATSVETG